MRIGPKGLFFGLIAMIEPSVKRAVSFFEGQNLFYHAKAAFGHYHPNYDPRKLSDAVCHACGWQNHGVRFYTGIPDANRDPMWYGYWQSRFLAMKRAGISVTARPLRYLVKNELLTDGTTQEAVVGRQEKGIDLRIGLDVVRTARLGQLDVAIIFSQDQDLAEVAQEIREIARSENRWLKIVSAFPVSPSATTRRGINNTDWFRMDRAFYDACLDPWDYRPRR